MKTIVFISHEATLTGAPILLLNIIRHLRESLPHKFVVVLGKDGPIRSKFEELATVIVYKENSFNRLRSAILHRTNLLDTYLTLQFRQKFQKEDIALIFSNTIANGRFLEAMQLSGEVPVISYVHELKFTMDMQQLVYGDVNQLLQRTNYFLAGSDAVRQELLSRGVEDDSIQIIFSSIQFEKIYEQLAATNKVKIRQELNLAQEAKLVIAIGTASWRKGNDWFVEMAAYLSKLRPNLHFVWVGVSPGTVEHMQMSHDIRQCGLDDWFTLVPVTPYYLDYLALADVFVLPSREDPFPLVVLEAAVAGKPTVCFAGAGGSPEFVGQVHGVVVPYGNVVALADAVEMLLANPARAQEMGLAAREVVRQDYSVHQTATRIGELLNEMIEVRA